MDSSPRRQDVVIADITSNNKQHHQKDNQSMECPRCKSSNTKFCYYNNYSLTQPRYFCKSCRRYWTQGGTLRNVPIGGSSRKNHSKNSSTSSSKFVLDMSPNPIIPTHDPTPSHHRNAGGLYYFGTPRNQEMAPRMELAGDLGLGSCMAESYPITRVPSFNGTSSEYTNNAAPEWFFHAHQSGEFGKLANAASGPLANHTPAVDDRHENRDHKSNGYWNHKLF